MFVQIVWLVVVDAAQYLETDTLQQNRANSRLVSVPSASRLTPFRYSLQPSLVESLVNDAISHTPVSTSSHRIQPCVHTVCTYCVYTLCVITCVLCVCCFTPGSPPSPPSTPFIGHLITTNTNRIKSFCREGSIRGSVVNLCR